MPILSKHAVFALCDECKRHGEIVYEDGTWEVCWCKSVGRLKARVAHEQKVLSDAGLEDLLAQIERAPLPETMSGIVKSSECSIARGTMNALRIRVTKRLDEAIREIERGAVRIEDPYFDGDPAGHLH